MCGRYQLQLDAPQIAALHQRASWRAGHAERHIPRNEVRPATAAPVLVRPGQQVEVVLMRWGMQAQGSLPSPPTTIINARREGLLRTWTFRRALLRQGSGYRCVIPATGFYEWYKPRGGSRGTAEPFLVRQKARESQENRSTSGEGCETMFMAGLYDMYKTDAGEEEAAFAIITTAAHSEFAWLHDRQPCFLNSQDEVNDWLDSARVMAVEAVDGLLWSHGGMSWKRMVPDLSEESENQAKPKLQSDIKSFFAPKSSEMRPGSKLGIVATAGSLRKNSTKTGTPPRRGVQKKISGFFK